MPSWVRRLFQKPVWIRFTLRGDWESDLLRKVKRLFKKG